MLTRFQPWSIPVDRLMANHLTLVHGPHWLLDNSINQLLAKTNKQITTRHELADKSEKHHKHNIHVTIQGC